VAEERVQRRLTAILAADVVGYSRLMGIDEAGTRSRFNAHLAELINPAIENRRGRIVKTMGDGLLVEFASVVDAVECAVDIQTGMAERNLDVPDDQQIVFRIGVNLGDVIIEGDDIHGDGVNVAARLESLADPGGIVVSDKVQSEVRARLDLGFDDLGLQEVKNISEPVRAYGVLSAGQQTTVPMGKRRSGRHRNTVFAAVVSVIIAAAGIVWWQPWSPTAGSSTADHAKLPVPERPSIAVLPFVNMSAEKGQEYFADGIADDLITDLSKLPKLAVTARNSSFYYKGKNIKLQDVATELGVRYVVEGSVRRVGDRVRINAQLIDARTNKHLWAERYDRDMQDIFAVQDGVVQHIVESLSVKLTANDRARIQKQKTSSVDAHDFALRAKNLRLTFKYKDARRAMSLYEKALEIDPNYVRAYVALGRLHHEAWRLWGENRSGNLARAIELGNKALTLDPDAPDALMLLAQVHNHQGEAKKAGQFIQKAMALAPNDAETLAAIGEIFRGTARSGEAIGYLKRAMQLDPHHPTQYLSWLGHAYFVNGNYDEAIPVLRRGLARAPNYVALHVYLAASYAMVGKLEEAKAAGKNVLKLNPKFTLRAYKRYTLSQSRKIENMMIGLRKAGLPE
jgi:adenylate cyclase